MARPFCLWVKQGMQKNQAANKLVRKIYTVLDRYYGDLKWWPGETPFEVIVGAILTQNTNWENVSKAIKNLKAADMLWPDKLHNAEHAVIAGLIRPAGYYNVKAKRLRNFLDFLFERFGGKIDSMFSLEPGELREKLLNVNGIGEETADSILLYAGGMPVFVVDAYTKRIMTRHGIIEGDAVYQDIQKMITANLPGDVKLYNQYHALIVQAGKDFCRKKQLCGQCPLKGLDHA